MPRNIKAGGHKKGAKVSAGDTDPTPIGCSEVLEESSLVFFG